jgi:SAM-dependent methyltransferase
MIKIDLTWNDNDVLPDKLRPDVEFLFSRMSQATIRMVDPKPGDRILDIGCGRAMDIVAMSKYGSIVIGVEPSSVMLEHARQSLKLDGHRTGVLQAIAESIPVVPGSIDKIVCKGALDHFADPEGAVRQMAAAIKPAGTAVIAIANFESLGFKIGKLIFSLRKLFNIRNPYSRLPWEIPPDHTMKFDYDVVVRMVRKHMRVEEILGVSMLCSMPGWGDMLSTFPRVLSDKVLGSLDCVSRYLPFLSDVIILKCTRKQPD